MRAFWLTLAALVGFAANSVLCRMALAGGEIDAGSFTGIRLLSGACMLALLRRLTRPSTTGHPSGGNLWSGLSLFIYAAAFSLAYLRLQTGVGALVLFGTVQLTMVGFGLLRGERLSVRQWLGFALALGGLVGLTAPGTQAPDPLGAGLMAVSGAAWGSYSLRGRGVRDPLAANASNFALTLPFAGLLWLTLPEQAVASSRGVLLGISSGALASGLAYSLWYAALRYLGATQAAVVQLSVPVMAAAGGVLLLAEPLSPRLLWTGAAILVGVAAVVTGPARSRG